MLSCNNHNNKEKTEVNRELNRKALKSTSLQFQIAITRRTHRPRHQGAACLPPRINWFDASL